MDIRLATVSDAKGIAKLQCALAKEDGIELPMRDGWEVGMLKDTLCMFQTGKVVCVVAEEGGEIVGFIGGVVVDTSAVFQPFLMGFGIYVSPEYRGGSVLARMFRLIKDACDSIGVYSARITTKHAPQKFGRFGFKFDSNVLTLNGGGR